VSFNVCVGELAELEAVAADVLKDTVLDQVVVGAAFEIEADGGEVFESAVFEGDIGSIFHGDGSGRTTDPCEVVEAGVIGRAFGGEFFGVEQIHSGLEWHVTLL